MTSTVATSTFNTYTFTAPVAAQFQGRDVVCFPDTQLADTQPTKPSEPVGRFVMDAHPVTQGDFYHFSRYVEGVIFLFDSKRQAVVAHNLDPMDLVWSQVP